MTKIALTFAVSTHGRPPFLTKDGAVIYLGGHDAWFLQERRRLTQRMLDVHPDRDGGSDDAFRDAERARRTFLLRESEWYRWVGFPMPCAMSDRHVNRGRELSDVAAGVVESLRRQPYARLSEVLAHINADRHHHGRQPLKRSTVRGSLVKLLRAGIVRASGTRRTGPRGTGERFDVAEPQGALS